MYDSVTERAGNVTGMGQQTGAQAGVGEAGYWVVKVRCVGRVARMYERIKGVGENDMLSHTSPR